ncbi:RNA polymerase sigma factor [Microbacterium sp. VKM Ac-2923]|nr:RNA polymerase sigma factor [Microbacterium sp. VKM Ac-2923]
MPALAGYFQRRVRPDDAPDLLGETLVVAWRRVAETPDGVEATRMWLFGIARGTLLNHARGERRRLALVDRIRSGMSREQTASSDVGTDVRDAVDRLDENLAEIVKLIHWDGFTMPEAATILGVPLTTVRSRYRRARETLRETLGIERENDSGVGAVAAIVTGPARE